MSEALIKDRQGARVTDDTRGSNLGLAENALRVLRARYLKKDEDGKVTELPADLFRRVARAVAEPETLYDPDPTVRS